MTALITCLAVSVAYNAILSFFYGELKRDLKRMRAGRDMYRDMWRRQIQDTAVSPDEGTFPSYTFQGSRDEG